MPNSIVEYRLSTPDNPYNPWTQFDKWYQYDIEKGYNSCGYLARIYQESPRLSEYDNVRLKNAAIDEIINLNGGYYIKVAQPNN